MRQHYYTCDICGEKIDDCDMYSVVAVSKEAEDALKIATRKYQNQKGALFLEPNYSFSFSKDLCENCAKRFREKYNFDSIKKEILEENK